ncbi:MAG: hypothetical protein NXH91_10395 [Phyllobacteriaceae bacterium]|nr:hypothetical protein [Phyllobacteriaceae bacterium]
MQQHLTISLSFDGATASNGLIDFYDAQRALHGFQRSLALSAHLARNQEIITQAPSLRNLEIYAFPPEIGSWKFTAVVISGVLGGIHAISTADNETPLGHLIGSIYDYALHQTFGIDLDYEKTIRELVAERGVDPDTVPSQERLSSLVEKTQNAVIDLHRPIERGSARTATVTRKSGGRLQQVGPDLNHSTLEAARFSKEGDVAESFEGRISSYNMNTFKGRIYLPAEERTIPFELADSARTLFQQRALSRSLDGNVARLPETEGNVILTAIPFYRRSGDLKSILVLGVAID